LSEFYPAIAHLDLLYTLTFVLNLNRPGRRKANQQQASSCRVFSGDAGEKELMTVKATTRKMRRFWERLAMGLSHQVFSSKPGEKDPKTIGLTTRKMRRLWKCLTKSPQHHSHLPNALEEVNIAVKVELQNEAPQADFVTADAGGVLHQVDIQSIANGNVHQGLYSWNKVNREATSAASSKMKTFWKEVEAKSWESCPSSREKMSSGTLLLRDVTVRVDLGLDQAIPDHSSGSGSLQRFRPLQTVPTLHFN
jgi:hypothetical protein